MDIAAGLIKLKPGSGPSVEAWRDMLQQRREEAVATLVDEGVEIESWFEISIDGEDYLLWYMRAHSIEKVWEVASCSQHEIDAYHFSTMRRITAEGGNLPAVPLFDMSLTD